MTATQTIELERVETIDLHVNYGMVIRTLKRTLISDGEAVPPPERNDRAGWRSYRDDLDAMTAAIAAAELEEINVAAAQIVAIMPPLNPTLDYRTLAPCGRYVPEYAIFGEGVNWSIGVGNMFGAIQLVIGAAAANFAPIEAAMDRATLEVNARSPRFRENVVRQFQAAENEAAKAFMAAELSKIQHILDRFKYRMMRRIAEIIGIDAGEEWIASMERQTPEIV